MNPILCLDIDGCLLCASFWRSNFKKGHVDNKALSKDAVERLNRIVSHTNCDIVISSSWRYSTPIEQIKEILENYGFVHSHKVIGITPTRKIGENGESFHMVFRGEEIHYWFELNPQYKNSKLCIIDDDSDMLDLNRFLVKTSWENGLQDSHVTDAINLIECGPTYKEYLQEQLDFMERYS
jgi:hypothetical protein